MTPMKLQEYLQIPVELIPQQFIDQYQLQNKIKGQALRVCFFRPLYLTNGRRKETNHGLHPARLNGCEFVVAGCNTNDIRT